MAPSNARKVEGHGTAEALLMAIALHQASKLQIPSRLKFTAGLQIARCKVP